MLHAQCFILVIVGPTSSGKSELAISLAKRFNGEIVSADSRQIYSGLNLGTGKVPGKWFKNKTIGSKFYEYKSIRHHLLDSVSPEKQYSVALFQRDAKKAILDITARGKLPILTGGTAHWIDAVVFNQQLPDVKPNFKLRARLEKKSADEIYRQLIKFDQKRAGNIDRHNKRRLIRALEIINATKESIPVLQTSNSIFHALWLGIKVPQTDLYKKIDRRLKQRLKAGMVKEVSRLHKQGLSWRRLIGFGLEYRFVSLYLQGMMKYEEMITKLSYAIKHYSKRQMTWWKRNKEINWIKPNLNKTINLTRRFVLAH